MTQEELRELLRSYLRRNYLTPYKFAKEADIPQDCVYKFLKGRDMRLHNIKKLEECKLT